MVKVKANRKTASLIALMAALIIVVGVLIPLLVTTGVDPALPVREGYTFSGWYADQGCTTEWDGVLPVSAEEKIELYAGWDVA